MKDKVRVGLTATIGDQYQAIWGSGITQNICFLYWLFEKAPRVSEVYIADLTLEDVPEKTVEIGNRPCKIISAAASVDKVDVLIEVGTLAWKHIAEGIQAKGGKVISMRCGNAFNDEVMGIFHNRPSLIPNNEVQYDQVWVLPHHAKQSGPMLQTLLRTPVHTVPYIWDSVFIERVVQSNPQAYPFGWKPGKKEHTVIIAEPNLGPVKTFHIPLLACEEAWRKQPGVFKHVYAMNTYKLNESPTFVQFVYRLDVTKQNIATFESRMDIVTLMSHYGDIVVSHHVDNGLNNLYFDTLYGHYPLIHNSEFIKDYGYYFEACDCQEAGRLLGLAIADHDKNLEAYKAKCAQFLAEYSIYNASNIAAYDALVWDLAQTPARARN